MEHKKKIMWVLNGLGQNGISMFVINYLENLDKDKFEYILGISGNTIDDNLLNRIKKTNVSIVKLPCRKNKPIEYFFAVSQFIRKNKIDLFHIHGNSSTVSLDLMAAKIGGCRYRIAHCHNSECDYKRMNKILQPVLNRLYYKGFACSENAAFNMFGVGWGKRNVTVLKNAIDTSKFFFSNEGRSDVRGEFGIDESTRVICHIGGFNEQKNQLFLVKVASMLSKQLDYKILFVGDGKERQSVFIKANECGLADRVIFTGNREDIRNILSAADIFVLPSLFEGLGIVAIEAQSVGLPCLLSDAVPPITKILDSTKYIPLNEEVWVREIQVLIENSMRKEDAWKSVREAGWDIKDNAKKLELEYEMILK